MGRHIDARLDGDLMGSLVCQNSHHQANGWVDFPFFLGQRHSCHSKDVVRHPLVAAIIEAYDEDSKRALIKNAKRSQEQ